MSNGKIDPKYSKLRWHILMAIKYYLLGLNVPQLNSSKIKASCGTIEKFITGNDDETIAKLRDLCEYVFDISDITRDKIKTPTFAIDVKSRALTFKD